MGHADYLKRGAWNVICDRCGFKFKNTECRMQATETGGPGNLFVCSRCHDKLNMQAFPPECNEDISVPIVRPEIIRYLDHNVTDDELLWK